jgi:hypothetical protein
MGASGSSIAALRAPAVPEGQIGVPGRVLQDSFKRVGAEWAGANVHSGANVHFALAIRQGRVAANQLHGGSVVGGSNRKLADFSQSPDVLRTVGCRPQ